VAITNIERNERNIIVIKMKRERKARRLIEIIVVKASGGRSINRRLRAGKNKSMAKRAWRVVMKSGIGVKAWRRRNLKCAEIGKRNVERGNIERRRNRKRRRQSKGKTQAKEAKAIMAWHGIEGGVMKAEMAAAAIE
jgi:hypothetical protein